MRLHMYAGAAGIVRIDENVYRNRCIVVAEEAKPDVPIPFVLELCSGDAVTEDFASIVSQVRYKEPPFEWRFARCCQRPIGNVL